MTADETDLFEAVARDNPSAVTTRFLRGASPNVRDAQGQTPLTLALRDAHWRAAQALFEHPDIRIDAENGNGETPLMMAALKGQIDWMAKLLAKGARVNRVGWTPLHYAAAGPSAEAVDWLLAREAAIDARSPNGTTPLMMAARYGDERAALQLLERGANPRLSNERNLKPADFAQLAGRRELAERLGQAAR